MQYRLWQVCSVIAFSIALIFSNSSARAQSSFGQIAGTVVDSTGAAIPGATVTITSTNTRAARTVTSDEEGDYIATNLPIDAYAISVTKAGFRTAQQAGVTITADAKVTSNFTLQPAQATEVVQVEAGAIESLNTTSGELARVIDSKQVDNLALNGRNYTQLLTLVPGAVVTNPDIFAVTTSLASTKPDYQRQPVGYGQPDGGRCVQPGCGIQRLTDEQRRPRLHPGSQD